MNNTTKKKSFAELISDNLPVLVDFWANWCGPCHTLAPTIKQIASEFGGKLKVIKIDVDKNPTISGQYSVQGIPTLILFKNSKILWRQSGVIPYNHLKQQLNTFLN